LRLYLSCDDNYLSPYQVVLRKQIELFEAQPQDTGTVQGRNRRVQLGQVGLRCQHCRFQPKDGKASGAAYFPTSLNGVYQAAQNMSKHLLECQYVPESVRMELRRLREEGSGGGGGGGPNSNSAPHQKSQAGKEAWAQRAAQLGVYEDAQQGGLRFQRDWSYHRLAS